MLNERADYLLLGHNFAQQQIGFIQTLDLNDDEPLKQCTLLEVEVAAHKVR